MQQTETLSPFYQLEISREGNLDLLTVNVEGSPPLVAQGQEAMDRVAHKAQKDIKDFIGVTARVIVKRTGDLPRSEGKAVRVIDHRKLKDK